MSDLILHHYKSSPFAEKIRRVLAFKQLAWQSVNIPPIAPKPDVEALTGGYRKTPILQIGADVYCDTALICDVLEHRQPTPSLSPPSHKGLARVLAQWGDTTLFAAAMAYNFQPQGTAQLFAKAPPGFAQAFVDDRAKMGVLRRACGCQMPPPPTSRTCAASPACWKTRRFWWATPPAWPTLPSMRRCGSPG